MLDKPQVFMLPYDIGLALMSNEKLNPRYVAVYYLSESTSIDIAEVIINTYLI